MKKLLAYAVLPLALASCNLFGITKGDVTGNISKAPTNQGTIRMAVLGVTVAGVTNNYTDQIAVVPGSNGAFAVTLPGSPNNGGYQVIAYADANNNSAYDLGETRTQDNGKVLVYSNSAIFGNLTGVPMGWSQWQNLSLTKTGTPFNNYDLTF